MFIEIPSSTIHYNIKTQNMTYKEIVCDESINTEEIGYLRQMHHLRHDIFIKKLKWDYGLEVIDQMEFDDFDDFECTYLVNVNKLGEVDASVRFLNTENSYLLGDRYSHFIQNQEIPRKPSVSELTRFAVKNTVDEKIFPRATAAIISWGLKNNIQNFVSLTRVGMYAAAKKIGWNPCPMGEPQKTPNDTSIALIYSVNKEMLNSVCKTSRIDPPIIACPRVNDFHL